MIICMQHLHLVTTALLSPLRNGLTAVIGNYEEDKLVGKARLLLANGDWMEGFCKASPCSYPEPILRLLNLQLKRQRYSRQHTYIYVGIFRVEQHIFVFKTR
jgi:hypothetical protein